MAASSKDEKLNNLQQSEREDIFSKHKQEKKDLQAQILKLKHTVTKGDKKKKKDVTEQIAKLESELEARHSQEVLEWKSQQSDTVEASLTPEPEVTNDCDQDSDNESSAPASNKKSKAQKRRDKKQAKGKERDVRIKEQEVQNIQGPRQQELTKIKAILKQKGLQIYEIPADGNCLYSAVTHQLSLKHSKLSSIEDLRIKTSDYLRSHKEEFLPFLTNGDTGDMMTEDEFDKYCDKTAKSPVWGGQIELKVLSDILKVPIEVIQAEASPQIIGEGLEGPPLTLVYHRHIFRLGEHYNSVAPADTSSDLGEDAAENEAS